MKIIDSHIHFKDNEYFHRIAKVAGHVNSEEHLRQQFKEHDIVHAVVMGGNDYSDEELLFPGYMSYCVGIDNQNLTGEHAARTLAHIDKHLALPRCVGVKFYPGYQKFSVANSICDPVYELVRKYSKTVAIHTGYTAQGDVSPYSHPDTVANAATRFPDIQFVMCHMGNPAIQDAIRVMREHPNIAADLSGILEGKAQSLEALLQRLGWFVGLLRDSIRELDDYSRFMYGTDWPLAYIGDYIGFVSAIIPEKHHQAVFYDNAVRIYGLNLD